MELNRGRLKATLIAGRIRPTDEALATLSAGLSTISYGYHIERVISEGAKTEAERRKELSQLHAALRTAISILDADMNGTRQIEILLNDPWHGSPIPEFPETLRSQSSRIEMLLTMLAQNTAKRSAVRTQRLGSFWQSTISSRRLPASRSPGLPARCIDLHNIAQCLQIRESKFPKARTLFKNG
jgi:hypothetical protein